ncbi:hypothetical protein LX32DRAFT_108335 [Colletotrichum zoysiae]|uniref:Secreted protein n=1 Tax=Colletotrichum zoysiae TaxID=1216348 RepID=A0AAD9H9S4_9PEZI|nr:hypothetical protein LX32DRAFT_108335 [Colletotrichum zoysiae]
MWLVRPPRYRFSRCMLCSALLCCSGRLAWMALHPQHASIYPPMQGIIDPMTCLVERGRRRCSTHSSRKSPGALSSSSVKAGGGPDDETSLFALLLESPIEPPNGSHDDRPPVGSRQPPPVPSFRLPGWLPSPSCLQLVYLVRLT